MMTLSSIFIGILKFDITMMETKENDICHPDGKILLLNGNVLDCYPKSDPSAVIQKDRLELDRTGEYLRVGKPLGKKPAGESREKEDWEDLFFKEAFFLFENKDRILSDSRMFLTPLPFRNGLAYTGSSGLNNATLGIYMEWWDSCEKAVIKYNGEVIALTYHIAGSPLSGSNHCSAVTRKGQSVTVQFQNPFYDIWGSFMQINQRYAEAKQIYQAYSLEETIAILHDSDDFKGA